MSTTDVKESSGRGSRRPTAWWLAMLRRRATRMYEEKLDLREPIRFADDEERAAAIAFFNAAYRAEESGLTQAHALAEDVATRDPDRDALAASEDLSAVSIAAAERAVDRGEVAVTAL
jgi:hypothetical protein